MKKQLTWTAWLAVVAFLAASINARACDRCEREWRAVTVVRETPRVVVRVVIQPCVPVVQIEAYRLVRVVDPCAPVIIRRDTAPCGWIERHEAPRVYVRPTERRPSRSVEPWRTTSQRSDDRARLRVVMEGVKVER